MNKAKQQLCVDGLMAQTLSYVFGKKFENEPIIRKLLENAWLGGTMAGFEEAIEEYNKWRK